METDTALPHTKWNLAELRDMVFSAHGAEVRNTMDQCAQSILKHRSYAKYHYQCAAKLLATDLDKDPQQIFEDLVLPSESEVFQDFHDRRLKAEANLVAMMFCLHASMDNLGHVIYYALNFDAKPGKKIDQDKISISGVAGRLDDGELKAAVQKLLDDDVLKHVAALVNHSKHRSVIGTPLSVSFVEDVETHGLKFGAFTHRRVQYPGQWANRFATQAFDALQGHVMTIGPLLNKQFTPPID